MPEHERPAAVTTAHQGAPTRSYTVRTTRRTTTIEASSVAHAVAIFTGHARPVGVPPAPRPAEHADGRPTGEWLDWWREHREQLWHRLDRASGEGLVEIVDASLHLAAIIDRARA